MKVQVDTLVGAALAWAALKAEGHAPVAGPTGVGYRSDHGSWVFPTYTDAEATALMVTHWIGVERPSKGQTPPAWRAIGDFRGDRAVRQHLMVVSSHHTEFSIAVTRCFVKTKFGEELDVPDDVLEVR